MYQSGNSPEVDEAIAKHSAIEAFLTQEEDEHCTIDDTLAKLSELSGIEIPEDEYVENPAESRKTVAQLVKEHKKESVVDANSSASKSEMNDKLSAVGHAL